jgi:hypothetical protein
MDNNVKIQYEIFKAIQDKIENDEEFAQKFYNDITENLFHYSQLTKIEDVKLGDSYPYHNKMAIKS